MYLGNLRIEYRQDGNLIQLFNSAEVCSLVINGEIVDRYNGFILTRFILKGTISFDESTIEVQAKMGFFFMTLYYNDKRVAKKFMGLG